jgi:hypothetical protein
VPAHDPDIGHHAGSPVARHRVGATPSAPSAGAVYDGNPKPVRLWLRLTLIMAIGVLLTGTAVEVTSRMHGTSSPTASELLSPSVTISASDPAWTVPGPSASPSPAPSASVALPRRTTSPAASPAPTALLLGPNDSATLQPALTAYCRKTAGDTTVAVPAADGSWTCMVVPDNGGTVDMDAMCRWYYGDDAWSKSADDDDPYGYRCYSN